MPGPRPTLRQRIRRYLGTDSAPRTETLMATVLESLQALAAQQQEASAAQQASFTNLQGAIARLEQAVRDGQASPEVAAALDDLKRGFDTMLEAAHRGDDGYEPPAVDEPTPDVPADPTPDVPAAPGDDTPPVDGGTARRR